MRYRQRHNLFTCSLLRLLHFFLLHFFHSSVLQHFCVVVRTCRIRCGRARAFYDTFVLERELTGFWTDRGPRHRRVLVLLSNDTFVLLNYLPFSWKRRMFWAMFSYRSPIHGRGTQTFGKKVSWVFLHGYGYYFVFLVFLHFFDFDVFLFFRFRFACSFFFVEFCLLKPL